MHILIPSHWATWREYGQLSPDWGCSAPFVVNIYKNNIFTEETIIMLGAGRGRCEGGGAVGALMHVFLWMRIFHSKSAFRLKLCFERLSNLKPTLETSAQSADGGGLKNSIISEFPFKSWSEHWTTVLQPPLSRRIPHHPKKKEKRNPQPNDASALITQRAVVMMQPRHTELQSLFSPSESRILTGWVLKRHPWRLSSNWIDLHLILLPGYCGCLPLIRARCRVSQASISLTLTLSPTHTHLRAQGAFSYLAADPGKPAKSKRPHLQRFCERVHPRRREGVSGSCGPLLRRSPALLRLHYSNPRRYKIKSNLLIEWNGEKRN